MQSYRWLPLLLLAMGATAHAADAPERQQILQLLTQGKNAEALVAARDWTTHHPDLPDALLLYADVQQANDDVPGALDSLDSAYFLTHDVNILVRAGRVLLEAGQYPQAEKRFQDALRQQESCVPAHVGLALVMMARDNPLEAGAALQAALALEPKSVEALVASGKLRLMQKQPEEARQFLERALQLDPKVAEAYLSLGQVAAEAGDMTRARAAWLKYIELDPGSSAQWQLAHNLYPIGSRAFECTGYYPSFARDGQRFAFRGRGDAGCVYLSTLDNPTVYERIYEGTGTIYSLDWSPDGKHVLVKDYVQEMVQGKPQYTYRLLLIEARAGVEAKKLYEGRYIGNPAWLPDSQGIVFDGYVANKGRPLLRLPISGGEPQIALTPQNDESFSGCLIAPTETMPADGSLPKLLLHRWHVPSREYQVVRVDPKDRSHDEVLARSPQSLYYTGISPDGRTLLYYRRVGQPPTWSLVALALNEQGGGGHALPFRTVMPMPPALTADCKHLVLYDRQGLQMVDLVGVR